MSEQPSQEEIVQKILAAIEKEYGFVPLVNQVMSERPDLFIPSVGFSKAVLEGKDLKLEKKTVYLCAVAAATAVGGEYCIMAQGKHAKAAGATKDEILEAMTIGSMMAMTRAQSYAFRKYKELFEDE